MRFPVIILAFCFAFLHLAAQSSIKFMSYNLMHYPGTKYYNSGSHQWEDRTPLLRQILDSYQPDIFTVCEIQEAPAADFLLNNALNWETDRYDMADFIPNQSGGDDLQQMLFYNTQKLELTGQGVITTSIRDINHYTLKVLTPDPDYIDVFVAHLKSSQGEYNETKRWQMVQQFTDYLVNIPANHYVIFAGDLNLYSASEPAYQELMDPDNAIVLTDPADAPVNWHNNYDYSYLDTQSPLTDNSYFQSENGGYDGVTGGMDDRFDFILLSEGFFNDQSIAYTENSYSAYGNNGNCFNQAIDDPGCSGEYSQELRNLLGKMSDHIPVVLSLHTTQNIGTGEDETPSFWAVRPNPAHDFISLYHHDNSVGTVDVYNFTGQKIQSIRVNNNPQKISVSGLPPGLYYLRSRDYPEKRRLVFIKE